MSELFLQLVRHLHTGNAEPWLDLNLTMPQLKMLLVLDWVGPLPMSQLASQLGISVSAATGLVDRLVEQGLARREHDPRDRRVVLVDCSTDGRVLVAQLRTAGGERLAELLATLNAEQLYQCLSVMDLLNRAAEATLERRATGSSDTTLHGTR